jgi:hypothetical protein
VRHRVSTDRLDGIKQSLNSQESTGFPFDGSTIIAPFWAAIATLPNQSRVWLKDFSRISDRNVLALTYENIGYVATKSTAFRCSSWMVKMQLWAWATTFASATKR